MIDRKELWNSVASYYDAIWEVSDYSLVLRSIVLEAKISLGMKVLDVASGTGVVGIEVAKKVGDSGKVYNLDYSKLMMINAIKKAKALGLSNLEFVLADAHHIPFPDDYFDVVTCCWGMSFFYNPEKAAKEMTRVTKRNGRVICVEWEKPQVKFWLDLREKAGIRDFEESELIDLLYNSGLKDVYTRKIQVTKRQRVSQELMAKSKLYVLTITGLKEENGEWFFERLNKEYSKLPPNKKHWLPILYVGIKK